MKRLLLASMLFMSGVISAGTYADYGLPSYENLIIKQHYTLSYDKVNKVPRWVAYSLTADDFKSPRKRSGKWKTDNEIPYNLMATNKDYAKSSYDKGHLVPSADMVRSAKAMEDTFVFSNCAPQDKTLNRGIWASLEEKTRKWATKRGEIIVYTGIVFDKSKPIKRIGSRKIGVPHRWYKVVFDPKRGDIECFIFTNEPQIDSSLFKYQVTLADIQVASGLKFIQNVPEKTRVKLLNKKTRWR